MYADWESHAAVVRGIARKHLRPGVTHDELCTVGMTGLWQAAQRYDPGRGVAFACYAAPRINGEIADYVRTVFGRGGHHAATASLTRSHPPACRDKGMAAVDARDEIEVRTRNPVEHVRTGGRRFVTWRGETMPMNGWARRLGMTQAGLSGRVDRWGVATAITKPYAGPGRPRRCSPA